MPNRWITPAESPPSTYLARRLLIPTGQDWIAAVSGCLIELAKPGSWEQIDGITPDEAAAAFDAMFTAYSTEDWSMIGVILPYASADVPANCLACDGATYNRVDYPALFAALDDAFLLDADTFKVPDLRGRTAIGTGTGTGLSSRSMGDSVGSERITLSTDEIPSHAHGEGIALPAIINGGVEAPAASATPSSGTTGFTGGGSSHDNMMPSLALGYCIIAR